MTYADHAYNGNYLALSDSATANRVFADNNIIVSKVAMRGIERLLFSPTQVILVLVVLTHHQVLILQPVMVLTFFNILE